MASLGGLIKGAIGTVAHQIPGVSQAYDLFNAVAGLAKNKKTGPIIGASLPMPVPSIIGSSGGKVAGGGTLPVLAPLSKGGGGVFSDVSSGHSTTARSGRRRYRRMNPMNVRALRRAARRLESGEKLFKKVFSMIHHKPAGAVRFKKAKRRA